MKEKRRVVDAKFRVVRGPSKLQPWNGVGLPPEWPQWPLLPKLIYGIGAPIVCIGCLLLARWIVAQFVG